MCMKLLRSIVYLCKCVSACIAFVRQAPVVLQAYKLQAPDTLNSIVTGTPTEDFLTGVQDKGILVKSAHHEIPGGYEYEGQVHPLC